VLALILARIGSPGNRPERWTTSATIAGSSPTPEDPMPDPAAFLGLGTMGAAMAANLARAGFPLTAWNRTPDRAPELADLGVTMAATPAEAAAGAGIVVICVSDTPDVEAVLFGDDGVVEGAQAGTLIVDCSTIAPSGSWDFAARLRERGLRMIDAPVSERESDETQLRRDTQGGVVRQVGEARGVRHLRNPRQLLVISNMLDELPETHSE
jgi:3-hydroxyisobutyrate dehydrogenase